MKTYRSTNPTKADSHVCAGCGQDIPSNVARYAIGDYYFGSWPCVQRKSKLIHRLYGLTV